MNTCSKSPHTIAESQVRPNLAPSSQETTEASSISKHIDVDLIQSCQVDLTDDAIEIPANKIQRMPHVVSSCDDMYDRATEAICRFALGGLLQAFISSGSTKGLISTGDDLRTRVEQNHYDGNVSASDSTSASTAEKSNAVGDWDSVSRIGVAEGWFTPSSSSCQRDSVDTKVTKEANNDDFLSNDLLDEQLIELLDHSLNREYVLQTIKEIILTEQEQAISCAIASEDSSTSGCCFQLHVYCDSIDFSGVNLGMIDRDVVIDEKVLFQRMFGTLLHPKSLKRSLNAMLEK